MFTGAHRDGSCYRTLPSVISLPVKQMSILPLVQVMFAVLPRLCRCASCMGLIECEDLESALQLTVPKGSESDLYRGYVESETYTKRKEELKKIVRGEVGGHTESEKEDREREGRGKRERIARSGRNPGYKEVKRGRDFTEREHKVTEKSNRHSGFDIPSASD